MLHWVQVTDTSDHQLFRGDYVNQAFMVELLQRNHYWRTPIIRRDLLGPGTWSPHVWFPPWSMEEEVWWCGGALLVTLGDLFWIQVTLNQHGYHSMLQQYAIPSGLRLVGLSLFFNRIMTQNTSRLCKGYLTNKESDGMLHQMTWLPQSPDLNPIKMVWDELDHRVREKQPASAEHMWEVLQDC